MKVFDVLSTMNPDALTSIQLETFSEPIAFGKVAFESRWTNIFEFGLTFKSNRIGRCFLSMQGALTLWDIGFSTVTNYYAKPPAKSSRRKWCKSKGNSVTAI